MKIVVFGATGGIGRLCVQQALAQGHEVIAPVRNPARMTTAHDKLRVQKCDVRDPACVAEAVAGQDAVLCAVGTPAGAPTTVFSIGTRNIVSAMEDCGVRRLVVVSNYCVLSETPRDIAGKLMLFLTRIYLRKVLPDQRQALEEVRESHLEWVAVRPLALVNAPPRGTLRIALDGLPPRGRMISRADVAAFMLDQIVSREYLRTSPAISW